MVPSLRRARSKKEELVKYIPEPDCDPKSVDIGRLVHMKPGVRMLIEVEALSISDQQCVAGNLCVMDGPNHQSFPDILLQIYDVRYK